jgi:hypothetical protein
MTKKAQPKNLKHITYNSTPNKPGKPKVLPFGEVPIAIGIGGVKT